MFGLKPPLYYLPGKRAVRLRGSARRRRAPAPTPHGPGAPRLRWGTGSADPRGRAGGRAARPLPRRSVRRAVRTCGGGRPPGPPPPPRRRRGCASRSFCLPGAGSAAAARRGAGGTAARRGERSPGVKLLCCRPPGSGGKRPPPTHGSGADLSRPPVGPRFGLRTREARLHPHPLSCLGFPGRFCSCRGRRRGRGKLWRVAGAASCFPALPAR